MNIFLKKYIHQIILFFLIALYIGYFTTATFLRHDNFYSGRYDLGNMDQAVWNTYHGRILETNNTKDEIATRLTAHADFILILIAPLYFIWEDPRMLLLVQTTVLSLGAIFIFLIGNKIFSNKTISIVFSFSYLMNPSIEYTNLYDFHAVTLGTTFLLGAYYFLIKGKSAQMLIFLLLAAITKENVWITTSIFGLWIIIRSIKAKSLSKISKKQIVLGASVFFVSVFMFYYLIWQLIPQTRGENHFALGFYKDFGDAPTSIVKNVFFSPLKVSSILLQKDRIDYVKKLLYPLGYSSLLAPQFLIFSLPDLAINMLSENTNLRRIYFHYTAIITPFIFIASMHGIKYFKSWLPKYGYKPYIVYIIIATLYSAYVLGPLPGTQAPNTAMFTKQYKNKEFINSSLKKIPDNAKVAATNNIGAHLAHRRYLHTIPIGVNQAEFLVFLLGDVFARPSSQAQHAMVEKLLNDQSYSLIARKDNFFIFKKLNNL